MSRSDLQIVEFNNHSCKGALSGKFIFPNTPRSGVLDWYHDERASQEIGTWNTFPNQY